MSLLIAELSMVQGGFLIAPTPLVQYQNDKRPTSQLEALLDEGLHATTALVCSL